MLSPELLDLLRRCCQRQRRLTVFTSALVWALAIVETIDLCGSRELGASSVKASSDDLLPVVPSLSRSRGDRRCARGVSRRVDHWDLKEREAGAKAEELCRRHGPVRRPSISMDCSPVARRLKTWLTWSIANIYPASPDDGAPKWGIRSHPPRQLVGLEGHYKSQGLGVPVRPVSPFSDPSRNLVHLFMQRRGTGLHFAARPRLPVRSCWRPLLSHGYNRAAGEVR